MNLRRFGVIGLGLILLGVVLGTSVRSAPEKYDVIIKGGKIVDGTGGPAYAGDVGIRGDRIVALGKVDGDAATVIEAKGLVVSPGFIDTHSHIEQGLEKNPECANYLMQGVTTVLGGPDGNSAAPRADMTYAQYLDKIEKMKFSVNLPLTVGVGRLREIVLGKDFKRGATPAEIEKMKALTKEAMQAGAFGLSSGLDPGIREYAAIEEHIECAKVAQKYGGVYCPHTRNHQNNWRAENNEDFGYGIFHGPRGELFLGRYHGLLEAIEIAHKANDIPVIIQHFTPAFLLPAPQPESFQAAHAAVTLSEIIDPPRKRGQKVYFNVIACKSSVGWLQPMIDPLLGAGRRNADQAAPPWLRGLTKDDFMKNLGSRDFRDKLRDHVFSGRFKFDMINPVTDPYWMDCYEIMTCRNKKYEGKTIGELARQRSPDNIRKAVYEESLEAMFDILAEDPDTTWALILDKREWPGAVPVFLKHPAGMPTQDGGVGPAEIDLSKTTLPSPEGYSHMPLYIDTYVNQRKALTLEEAIYKIGGMPAEILDLKDRGTLTVGSFADITVFDLGRIRMTADFKTPNRPPDGIEYVFVNGKLSYKNKTHTGAKAGKLLRHTQ
jgi:N-acyl-D-aspartate/D-glutamate deacylase